jgi:hypothetical protein
VAGIWGAILVTVAGGCGGSSRAPSGPPAPKGLTPSGPPGLTSTNATSTTFTPQTGCVPPAGAKTLAASSSARVFVANGTVTLCSTNGKGFDIGKRSGTCRPGAPNVGHLALAGQVLAVVLETCGTDTGDASITVVRLGSRSQATSFGATIGQTGPESFYSVDSLVASPSGSVGWIGSGSSVGTRKTLVEVHVAIGTSDRLLDSSPQIKKGSLRLRGSRLFWQDGAVTRSAAVP